MPLAWTLASAHHEGMKNSRSLPRARISLALGLFVLILTGKAYAQQDALEQAMPDAGKLVDAANTLGQLPQKPPAVAPMTYAELREAAPTNTVQPFTTDGCSNFPNGIPAKPIAWRHCCVDHDKVYWMGGSAARRAQADLMLKECVADAGYPSVARIMYLGVRAGGGPNQNASYRWGYGWNYLIGYNNLNEEQIASVIERVRGWEQAQQITWISNPKYKQLLLP